MENDQNGNGENINEAAKAKNEWGEVTDLAGKMSRSEKIEEAATHPETEEPSRAVAGVTNAAKKEAERITCAGLEQLFEKSRRDFESYASETDSPMDKIAPHFTEDEAFFNQVVKKLAGEGSESRRAEDISLDEVLGYYRDDIQKNNIRYNELNEEIRKKKDGLGFFGKHFGIGKGAREVKEMESEQNTAYSNAQKARQRLKRLESMLGQK